MRLPCPPLTAAPADGRVDLGVRPDDLLSGDACLRAPAEYRFEAVVSVVEPMGAELLLIITIDGLDLRVRLEGRNYPTTGARMAFAIDPDEVQLFDAATGISLRR